MVVLEEKYETNSYEAERKDELEMIHDEKPAILRSRSVIKQMILHFRLIGHKRSSNAKFPGQIDRKIPTRWAHYVSILQCVPS